MTRFPRSAADYIPPPPHTLEKLGEAAGVCRGCDLYKAATQVVFGEGHPRARIMLVGEVPGNAEDKQGRPFVGPAGGLLDRALEQAGIDRSDTYVTNAVKHFRFLKVGPYRYHRNPSGLQVRACRPWLEAELALVKPEVVVCLGATAARSVLGRAVTIREARGSFIRTEFGPLALVTVHPSGLLRRMELEEDKEIREETFRLFVQDLRKARIFLRRKAA